MVQKEKSRFPQNLEKGMSVTAICMGRKVGSYVVETVRDEEVTLRVASESSSRDITAVRAVGDNGSVTILKGGVPIQATDYFVQPL